MIDNYIDRLAASGMSTVRGRLAKFGPFGRVGSIFNVVFCGLLVVFGLVLGFMGEPTGFFLSVGIVMEIVFVRVAIRARRGDFDRL